MKILIAFFVILSGISAFAGDVTKMIIEYHPAVQEVRGPNGIVTTAGNAEFYTVTSYGLKDKGEATVTNYTTPADVAKIKAIESSPEVNASGSLKRAVIDFQVDGTVDKIDVQKEDATTFTAAKVIPQQKVTTDAVEAVRAQVDPIKDNPPPDPKP